MDCPGTAATDRRGVAPGPAGRTPRYTAGHHAGNDSASARTAATSTTVPATRHTVTK